MAQIFFSHSQHDKNLVDLFSRAFADTPVKMRKMEFERIQLKQEIKTEDIQKEINNSVAVFVLISENVCNIPHTRDWVAWETGYAAHAGKDIWIFEPISDFNKIDIVIPYFNHYTPIDVKMDNAYSYLRNIIESYDNSQILQKVLTYGFFGAIGLAMLAPPREQNDAAVTGGALGAFLGAAAADRSKIRPMGISTSCPHCHRIFNAHVPYEYIFRCPGCNYNIEITNSI